MVERTVRAMLVTGLLLTMALAGCAGGGDVADTGPSQTPQADDESGAIAGVVLNAELLPIEGADIALQETTNLTKSDARGNFTFNDLAPGEYTLVVQRLGFESVGRSVDVVIGEITNVEVILQPIAPKEEVFVAANPVSAHITFGHAWTDYYGGWDALPLCGQCEFYVHLDPNPSDIENEALWVKPVGADVFSHEIYYLLRKNTDNSSAATALDGDAVTSGYWQYGEMPRNMEDGDYEDALESLEDGTTTIQVKVGGGFYSVAYEQRVDIWVSFAYNGELPDDYSAFPPMETESGSGDSAGVTLPLGPRIA